MQDTRGHGNIRHSLYPQGAHRVVNQVVSAGPKLQTRKASAERKLTEEVTLKEGLVA